MIWTNIALAGLAAGVFLSSYGMMLGLSGRGETGTRWMKRALVIYTPCFAFLLWRYLVAA